MAAGATAMMVALHLIGMRTEIIRRRVRNLSQQLVQRESFNAPAHEEDAR
jgi:hypothetical protein